MNRCKFLLLAVIGLGVIELAQAMQDEAVPAVEAACSEDDALTWLQNKHPEAAALLTAFFALSEAGQKAFLARYGDTCDQKGFLAFLKARNERLMV